MMKKLHSEKTREIAAASLLNKKVRNNGLESDPSKSPPAQEYFMTFLNFD